MSQASWVISCELKLNKAMLFVRDVVEAFADDIQAVTFGKPTLADVFIHLTGHQLWMEEAAV